MSDDPGRDNARRLVDEVLLGGQPKRVHDVWSTVVLRARSQGKGLDGAAVLEYWSDLMRCGAIAVPGDAVATIPNNNIPSLLLTASGRRLLEHGERSPHNPSKYLAAVRERVRQPDDIALSYLSEAVGAWQAGLYRSSAVMLGCACERLVLLLAEAIAADRNLPGSEKVEKAIKGRVFISTLFDEIRSTLSQLKAAGSLARDVPDALDRRLSSIFDYARGLRNESGHPTGEDVGIGQAEAGLLLFPEFYELLDRLIMALSAPESAKRTLSA